MRRTLAMFAFVLAAVLAIPTVHAQSVVGWLGYPNDAGRTTGVKPVCGDKYRDMTWIQESAVGVADVYEVCLRGSNGAYAWTTLGLPVGGAVITTTPGYEQSAGSVNANQVDMYIPGGTDNNVTNGVGLALHNWRDATSPGLKFQRLFLGFDKGRDVLVGYPSAQIRLEGGNTSGTDSMPLFIGTDGALHNSPVVLFNNDWDPIGQPDQPHVVFNADRTLLFDSKVFGSSGTDGDNSWVVGGANYLNRPQSVNVATYVAIGGSTSANDTVASQGGLRLSTDHRIYARNRNNTADTWLIGQGNAGTATGGVLVGDTAVPTVVQTNLVTPTGLANGQVWVEGDGSGLTSARAYVKVQANGTTLTVADSISGALPTTHTYKTSDADKTNNTLAPDPQLSLTLDAHSTYKVNCLLAINTLNGTAGVKVATGGTATVWSSFSEGRLYDNVTHTLVSTGTEVNTMGTSTLVSNALSAGTHFAVIDATYETILGGTFRIDWAQLVTDGSNRTRMKEGSMCSAQKVLTTSGG